MMFKSNIETGQLTIIFICPPFSMWAIQFTAVLLVCPIHIYTKLFLLSRFILYTQVYVTRHDILCPNAVKRDVGKTRCKSDVIYATALCCAICTSLNVIC